jgi:cytoskeletal protein RodZ
MEMTTETVGQYLRKKREEKNISIDEVSLHTRILPAFIHAIEDDRFDKIANSVSVKGFVRSYLRFLKIDETETLKRLSDFLASPSPRSDLSPNTEMASVGVFSESVRSSDETSSSRPMLDLGNVGERIRIAPRYYTWVGGFVICLLSAFLFKTFVPGQEKQSEAPISTKLQTIVPAQEPPSLSSADLPVETSDAVTVSSAETASQLAASPEVPKPFILSLEAREATWVKISTDGKNAKDVLLKAGEKGSWEADASFLLTMGNGGGAEVFLDGKGLGFLGKKGEVVRDRLLTRVASGTAGIDNE